MANLSLAVNESFQDRKGKPVKQFEWVRCVAWNKLVEIAAKCVAKGKQLFVEGRLQTRRYRDGDGAWKMAC